MFIAESYTIEDVNMMATQVGLSEKSVSRLALRFSAEGKSLGRFLEGALDRKGINVFGYLIVDEHNSLAKIGIAKKPKERLCSIQSGNPFPLKLYRTYRSSRAFELRILSALSEYKVRGEWFRYCDGSKNILLKFGITHTGLSPEGKWKISKNSQSSWNRMKEKKLSVDG